MANITENVITIALVVKKKKMEQRVTCWTHFHQGWRHTCRRIENAADNTEDKLIMSGIA